MKKNLTVLLAAALAGTCLAGASLTTFTRFTLPAGVGATEVTMTSEYDGGKRNESGTTKMTGGVLGLVAGRAQELAEITRLDRELVWSLDHKGKTYAERGLTAPKAEAVEVKAEGSAPPPDRYRVTKAEVSVTTTGAEKTINGYPCKEHVLVFELGIEDTVEKTTLTQVMTNNLWMTPLTDELKAALKAQEDFQREFAKKAGFEPGAEGTDMGASALVMAYGLDPAVTAEKLAQAAEELEKLDGYPVVSDLKWQLAGNAPAAEEEEEEEEPAPSGLGGLGSMLGKAVAKVATPKSQPAADVLFSSYAELKSAMVADIPAGRFEVPEGYTRVEPK